MVQLLYKEKQIIKLERAKMGISNCRVGEVYYSAGPQLMYEILAASPTPEAGDVYVYFCKCSDLIDNQFYFTTIWDDFPDSDEWVLLPSYEENFIDTFKDDIYWVQ